MTQKSGNELLKQQTNLAPKSDKPPTFQTMLEQMKPEFAKVLPRALTAERLIRIALTEVRKNPTLGTCDIQSVIGAIMIGAQLGLEPGVMGQAYLVPYNSSVKVNGAWQKKMICTFIPGWQGYVDLVSRSGRASVWTGAVYEGDEFEARMGSDPFVHHIPDFNGSDDRELLYVYAVGRQKGSDAPVVDVWGVNKCRAHLARYNKVGANHYAIKDDGRHFEMYARKLPLLQVVKYLPKSVELALTASMDNAAEAGVQHLTIQSVKDDSPLALEAEFQTQEAAITPDAKVAEVFGPLAWGVEKQQAWLRENGELPVEQQMSLLEAELDKE